MTKISPWTPVDHRSGSDVQALWRKYGWTPPSEKITPPPMVNKEPAWMNVVRRKK
jgi:hypothetical protein